MSSEHKRAMKLAVAFHFVNDGKAANYSWVRFNGSGSTKDKTKLLRGGIPKKAKLEVIAIRTVSTALHDQEQGSTITVYLNDEKLSELINTGDVYTALRKAREKRSHSLSKAILSLAVSIAKHKDVTAVFTNAHNNDALKEAEERAAGMHDDAQDHKSRPGRRGTDRAYNRC